MKSLKDVKAQLLQDPEVSAEYEKQQPEFDIARELIAARVRVGMTQAELAQRMSTTQSTIANLRTKVAELEDGSLTIVIAELKRPENKKPSNEDH